MAKLGIGGHLFDGVWYWNNNKEVRDAASDSVRKAEAAHEGFAAKHYRQHGIHEGRAASQEDGGGGQWLPGRAPGEPNHGRIEVPLKNLGAQAPDLAAARTDSDQVSGAMLGQGVQVNFPMMYLTPAPAGLAPAAQPAALTQGTDLLGAGRRSFSVDPLNPWAHTSHGRGTDNWVMATGQQDVQQGARVDTMLQGEQAPMPTLLAPQS